MTRLVRSVRLLLVALSVSAAGVEAQESTYKPVLYLIGDSTVKNSTRDQMGWGTSIHERFDAERIKVENRALGGRSSRSYLREGLWEAVLKDIKPGDFVMMQFGHNDGGPIAEGKARASLKGAGEESKDVVLADSGTQETVHTYGWYLRRYISDAKAKGATVIVCSLVPRNIWKEGKVVRASDSYGKWAREAAEQEMVFFIDLNESVAREYEKLGADEVMRRFFTPADHTHTNAAGASFTADCVVGRIRALTGCPLAKYLLDQKVSAATASQ